MNDEYVHPWDQLGSERESAQPNVVTTPRQAFTGLQIGLANLTAVCTSCGRSMQEGERTWVYAYRAADDPEWLLTRCYCRECAVHSIETPTLGTSEALIEARLDVLSLSSEQRHQLCLSEVDLVAFSPLTEGSSP